MGRFRIHATCWYCGKAMPWVNNGKGRNRRTCSNRCRQKYYRGLKNSIAEQTKPSSK
jgi:predicted nucleic acid-binding Zn ribbon protein